jgi:IMP dehydrogenase
MNEKKVAFFERIEQQGLALTFDDVRLRTTANPDNPLPEPLDISSRFSRNVELNTPFVSAAMDTVTESRMAIAMAQLGGLGVLHAALSPQ